jgi:hypothetical protein
MTKVQTSVVGLSWNSVVRFWSFAERCLGICPFFLQAMKIDHV